MIKINDSFSCGEKLRISVRFFSRTSVSFLTLLFLLTASTAVAQSGIGTAIEEDLILRPGDSTSNDTSTHGTEAFLGYDMTSRFSDNILLYPNPVSKAATIQVKMPAGTELEAVELIDFHGQTVLGYYTSAIIPEHFSLEGLPGGRYVMRIRTQGGWVSKQIEIQ